MGRANYLRLTRTTDWARFTHEVLDVPAKTGAHHYIKKDLQPYLPPGYSNPKRVHQHQRPTQQRVQSIIHLLRRAGMRTSIGGR